MKKTGFQNKIRKPLKRSGFSRKVLKSGFIGGYSAVEIYKKGKSLLKRSPFKQKLCKPLRRTKLRLVGHSSTSELKAEIQGLLREIVIQRDGGCILRHYSLKITHQYQNCGGFRKDGNLILQAEHLHTRSSAASFSDSRLVVCLCQRHHGYYKPQHADEYYRIVKEHIGIERSKLLTAVQNDHTPHKTDLKLELLALKKELETLKPQDLKINL